jgi:6-phosphogluconate dehydrogenase
MIHNGIEYGMMQAYAEGFEILHASDYELDLGKISDLWNHGSVVRSWLLELAHAAFKEAAGPASTQGLGRRFRRGPLDGPGGDRPRRARARSSPLSLQTRFRSRQDDLYGAKVLAALAERVRRRTKDTAE